jgi:uncharacterized protein YjbI with pentapeptide repeats
MLKRRASRAQGIRWLAGAITFVVVALVIGWTLFVPAADWLTHHDVGSAKGPLLETARDAAQGRLLTFGAGLFAAGALLFTARNFTLSREGQVTDRYTKAIEQLGSDKLDTRIGGIYALERVARDSARDHPTVIEVLTAFIREHSCDPWPPSDHIGQDRERSTRADVQAAVTVVGRRDQKRDMGTIYLDRTILTGASLTRAALSRAILAEADLTRAWLHSADLSHAILPRTVLFRAILARANLSGAIIQNANLSRAILSDAILTGADLTGAILTGADLSGAKLEAARLDHANLAAANLIRARLVDANLSHADFTRADLTDADLSGAKLWETNLSHAILIGADLSHGLTHGVDLSEANLMGARWPQHAAVPAGWKLDTGTGRLTAAAGDCGPPEAS